MVKKKSVEEEPIVETSKPTDESTIEGTSEIVKVKVVVGTLCCEYGTFDKGQVFEVPKKRALLFDKNDVEILG